MNELNVNTVITWLSNPVVLGSWMGLSLLSLAWLIRDLRLHNPQITGLMRWVWILTVLYSGPLGLLGFYSAGRQQISTDSVWRRGFRSVAHCYSGCGAGEWIGLMLSMGLLGVTGWWVVGITFVFAYLAGFALTVGPLMQEGVPMARAVMDAVYSESASITVMELVAISVDQWLAGNAGPGSVLFWSSMMVSLTAGLVAAYPVNVLLIRWGVKEGMHDPRDAHAAH